MELQIVCGSFINWMNNHMAAHKYFVNKSGIVVPNAEINIPTPGSHPQGDLFNAPEQLVLS